MAVVHWDGMQWGRQSAGGAQPGPSDSDWDSIGPVYNFLDAGIPGPNGDRVATDRASSFTPLKKTFSNSGTITVSGWWKPPAVASTDILFKVWDGATVQCQLEAEPIAGKFTLRLRSGAGGSIQATSATQFTIGVWRWVSIKIPIANSATVVLKVDGFTEFNAAGCDTQNSGSNQANAVETMIGTVGNATRWCVFLLSDTASGVMNDIIPPQRSAVQFPTGSDTGAFNDWAASAGSRTSCVDEPTADANPNDDTDYVKDNVVGNKQSFSMSALPSIVGAINAYRVAWRVKRDDATPRQCRAFIRNAAGTIHNFPTRNIGASYETFCENLLLSPFTGVAFTKAECDGFQLGVEVMA